MFKAIFFGLVLCSSACVMEGDDGLSKQEAAELLASGKADSTFDPCAEYGWYRDGVCDGFCPQPDPDCDVPCTSSYQCPPGAYCSTEDGDCDSVCPDDAEVCVPVCGGVCLADPGPDFDAGPAPDGGPADGGPAPDGGPVDGGPAPDGGPVDGGPAPDGGPVDGGPAPDGGPADAGPVPF